MINLEDKFPPYKHVPNPELVHINLRHLIGQPLSEVKMADILHSEAVGEISILFSKAKVCVNQCGDRLISADDVQNAFYFTGYTFEDYKKLLPWELQKELTLTVKVKDGRFTGEYYPAEVWADICFELAYGKNPSLKQKENQLLVKFAKTLLGGLCLVGIIPLIDEATGFQSERYSRELMCLFNQSYLEGNNQC
jgi:hypothetical protein